MFVDFTISTQERYQLINITERVEEIVQKTRIKEGIVLIFIPHSTAGILLTEDEGGLKRDWLTLFKKIVSENNFFHNQIDNNADSHLLSGLIGQGKFLPVKEGRIIRGTWQEIFLAEFDGPRERRIIIEVVKNL